MIYYPSYNSEQKNTGRRTVHRTTKIHLTETGHIHGQYVLEILVRYHPSHTRVSTGNSVNRYP